MKTTNKVLSISLAVVIALSVFALPYNFGIKTASAAVDTLTLTTSADDHGKKFFGDSLLQVIVEDPAADDDSSHLTTTASVTIKIRDNTGSLLGTFTKNIPDTTHGSQRFEFFIKNQTSSIDPQDPDADTATVFTVGPAASSATHLGIGQALTERSTVEITYKSKTTTISYDDSTSSLNTDRDTYGLNNRVFLSVFDQDGNVDPTNRDTIEVRSSGNNQFVTMSGVTSFETTFCQETGDNTAEFECEYVVSTGATADTDIIVSDTSDNNVVVSAQDVSKYLNDTNADGLIDDTDDNVVSTHKQTGQSDLSVTIDDVDGELNDIPSVTMGSEIKITLTDADRNLSSKTEDSITSTNGTFAAGDSLSKLNVLATGASGVIVYIDASGGDVESVKMKETADGSGVFVPDLPNDELKVTFLAAGQNPTKNNGVLEFDSTNTDEDVVIAYVDPAPDGDRLASSITTSLTRVAGTVSVTSSVGINGDFKLTLNDADLNDNPRSKDSYKLVLRGDGDAPGAKSNTEFQLVRGSQSISNGPSRLYGTFEVELKGSAAEFSTPGLNYTLTETGINTGIFEATLDMGDILDDLGATVDDGDVMQFTYHDYMEDTEKESNAKLTIGRAASAVELSRNDAPIPPEAGGVVDTALNSDEVSVTLTVTDPDMNTQTGRQDTIALDLLGGNRNLEVDVSGDGFDAKTTEAVDDPALTGGATLQDIIASNGGDLNGFTLKETGANTGVFEEDITFHRGALTDADDWQDMRVTFIYIDADGDRESAGVTFRGHDAVVDADKTVVKSGDTLTVTIQDEDLNLDDTNIEEFESDLPPFGANPLLTIQPENDDINTGHHEQTFRETGENTGIFEATFDIGTDIVVIKTADKDQASNLHITYEEEVDSSGDSGDEIELDVPVVSSTGAIMIKPDLVGPGTEITVSVIDSDLNQKPDGKDIVAADKSIVEFRSDRTEVGKSSVDMEETGASTGVFEFTIQLLTDQNDCADDDLSAGKYDAQQTSGNEGSIGACPGDLVSVKYTDQQGENGAKTTVSKVVEVNSWDPEFAADKENYNIGDKATVTISDPDANRDPDVADTLRDIRVYSDTDQVGQTISAIETGKDTGVFKFSVALTSGATSGGIEVKSGDTVTVQYTDDFPADFVSSENDKDFRFALQVGTGGGVATTTPTAPTLKDATGKELSSVTAGQQVVLSTTIVNNIGQSQPYAAILEVRDSNDVTVFLGWTTGNLAASGQSNVGLSWTPDNSGSYTIRTFVLSDLNNPQILSEVKQSTITVS